MIRTQHQTDYITDDYDRTEDDTMVPAYLVMGVEVEVAHEDEDFIETLAWDYDLCRTARSLAARTFAYGF